jgi:UDP-N-acetylmuramyl tripeptide synthase
MNELLTVDLVKATGAELNAPDFTNRISGFSGVSIDSRTTKAGDCFFAISGENFDGHDYVCDAFAKGAVCAVVDEKFGSAECSDKCLLRVQDTVKALGDLAREYRRQAGFKVIAITEPKFQCASVTEEFQQQYRSAAYTARRRFSNRDSYRRTRQQQSRRDIIPDSYRGS